MWDCRTKRRVTSKQVCIVMIAPCGKWWLWLDRVTGFNSCLGWTGGFETFAACHERVHHFDFAGAVRGIALTTSIWRSAGAAAPVDDAVHADPQ
eukprot:1431824-Rhodomonas_salina.1